MKAGSSGGCNPDRGVVENDMQWVEYIEVSCDFANASQTTAVENGI
jgi:hypothetical protein